MGRAEQKARSQAMAEYMRRHGIRRTTQQCPICNVRVSNNGFYTHIVTHR